MTPSRLRDRLTAVQEELRSIEKDVEAQKAASVGYIPICHEIVESWEALERAISLTDEMGMGMS
jgi:hypothetical protein